MIQKELEKRNLPELLRMRNGEAVTAENWPARKQELLEILSENLYGFTPAPPSEVRATVTGSDRYHTFGGKATSQLMTLSFDTPGGEFSFPLHMMVPKRVEKPPVILLIAFRDQYPVPEEEIIDHGFALVRFHHHTVQPDDIHPDNYFANFTEGLGAMFIGDRKRVRTEWGKVGMWAYAASRVMDYLQTREDINRERIAVVGHSRNGKTALWCRAQDPRFFAALGNNTNYGGGGLIRGSIGEDVPAFLKLGSYDFFCEGWKDFYQVPHSELPFDQHFLVASIAPRKVLIGSAAEDWWADPLAEQLCCVAASPAFRRGFVCPDHVAAPGEAFLQGDIGYHLRKGLHYFSRTDWHRLMEFVRLHREERKAKQRNW